MNKSAVVIIDMQNDTVHAEGAFASTGAAEHASSQEVIMRASRVLEAARKAQTPVFHNRIVVFPGDVGGANAPIFRMLGPESFALGSWGAQIVDELAPNDGEIVLDRNRMSIFNGTGIDFMLRNLGITDLYLMGAWTNMAVEHSARDAADHGYRVHLVADATSSLNEQWQHAAENFALQNIVEFTDSTAVSELLGGSGS